MEETVLDINNIETDFPKYIELQTNSLCNGKCVVCPYDEISKKYKAEAMNNEGIEKIIKECDFYKQKIERMIPYLNNEPTLDKRLIDILRRIKKEGHYIELSSNFSGMTENDMECIIKEKLVDDFRISFFGGDVKTYSELMPGLNFESTVKKIKMFSELNQKYNNQIHIELYTVLCPWIDQADNIEKINKLFPELPLHKLGYLDRAENVKIFKNNLKYNNLQKIYGCSLNRPFERICVLANGDAILCSQDWNRSIVLGNVLKKSIYAVWNSEKTKRIRKIIRGGMKMENDFICARCKLALIEEAGKSVPNFEGDCYINENGEKLI